jgi:hypothetical protein
MIGFEMWKYKRFFPGIHGQDANTSKGTIEGGFQNGGGLG